MGVDAQEYLGALPRLDPPLRMPSLLPHDLCHEWNVSHRLLAQNNKFKKGFVILHFMCKCFELIYVKIIRPVCRYFFMKVKLLGHVQLFATPWTVDYQAPLSMRFFRQEYWSV